MPDAAASAEPTQPTWNPATGSYDGYSASAGSQGAATPAQALPAGATPGAPVSNDDEPTQSTWNPATGQYDGFPGGPSKKKPSSLEPVGVTAKKLPEPYDAAEFRRRVGRDPEPYELKLFQQGKGAGFPDPNAPASPVEQFVQETIIDPALTGAQKAKQVGAVLASPARSKEATAASIADAQKAIPVEPQFLQEADKVFAQQHTFLGVLDAYVTHPRAALASAIQGLVQNVGVMAVSAVGGAAATSETGPGALIGAAAGAGGAGYLDTYGETVLRTL